MSKSKLKEIEREIKSVSKSIRMFKKKDGGKKDKKKKVKKKNLQFPREYIFSPVKEKEREVHKLKYRKTDKQKVHLSRLLCEEMTAIKEENSKLKEEIRFIKSFFNTRKNTELEKFFKFHYSQINRGKLGDKFLKICSLSKSNSSRFTTYEMEMITKTFSCKEKYNEISKLMERISTLKKKKDLMEFRFGCSLEVNIDIPEQKSISILKEQGKKSRRSKSLSGNLLSVVRKRRSKTPESLEVNIDIPEQKSISILKEKGKKSRRSKSLSGKHLSVVRKRRSKTPENFVRKKSFEIQDLSRKNSFSHYKRNDFKVNLIK